MDRNESLELSLAEEDVLLEEGVRKVFHRIIAEQFPKICKKCRVVYETEADFVKRTKETGIALSYADFERAHFARNCESSRCQNSTATTLIVELDYNRLNNEELKRYLQLISTLGDYGRRKIIKDLKQRFEVLQTECGIYALRALKILNPSNAGKFVIYPDVKALTPEVMDIMGLNIFRARYNDWLLKSPKA